MRGTNETLLWLPLEVGWSLYGDGRKEMGCGSEESLQFVWRWWLVMAAAGLS